jgi:hypothetical protein
MSVGCDGHHGLTLLPSVVLLILVTDFELLVQGSGNPIRATGNTARFLWSATRVLGMGGISRTAASCLLAGHPPSPTGPVSPSSSNCLACGPTNSSPFRLQRGNFPDDRSYYSGIPYVTGDRKTFTAHSWAFAAAVKLTPPRLFQKLAGRFCCTQRFPVLLHWRHLCTRTGLCVQGHMQQLRHIPRPAGFSAFLPTCKATNVSHCWHRHGSMYSLAQVTLLFLGPHQRVTEL